MQRRNPGSQGMSSLPGKNKRKNAGDRGCFSSRRSVSRGPQRLRSSRHNPSILRLRPAAFQNMRFPTYRLPGGASGKNPPANAGDRRDRGLSPGLGRAPGGRHGHPLQCGCLEKPMDRRAWRATVHGVEKSWAWLQWLSSHSPISVLYPTVFPSNCVQRTLPLPLLSSHFLSSQSTEHAVTL